MCTRVKNNQIFFSLKCFKHSTHKTRLDFPAVFVPSTSFHEIRKNGYIDKTQKKVSTRQAIRDGLKELKQEIKNWTAEIKEATMLDPIMTVPLPGNPFQL